MRLHWIAMCAALACLAPLPASAQPPVDYAKVGMPAADDVWSLAELRTAGEIVASLPIADLPRAHDAGSSALFGRLSDQQVYAPCRAPGLSMADSANCMFILDDAIAIYAAYLEALKADRTFAEEIVILSSFCVELVIVVNEVAKPVATQMDPAAPGYASRMEGFAKMKGGWSNVIEGAVMILVSGPYPDPGATTTVVTEEARIGLARAIVHGMSKLELTDAKRAQLAAMLKNVATSDASLSVRSELAAFAD